MSGEGLRAYFQQLFAGDAVTPRQGSHLTVATAEGSRQLRVQDVTNIGVHERADGGRAEQFSVILEGDRVEIDLRDDTYEFVDGTHTYPMAVRSFGPEDAGLRLYEGLFEIEE